jgi:5-methyltetrahydropteroyltriglutamate--homocysteine methyltransferase
MALVTNLGYPRIGPKRELKRSTEGFWKGKVSEDDLLATSRALRERSFLTQAKAGVDLVPCGDFSLYDHVLDMAVTVGCIPEHHRPDGGIPSLDTYFSMARGSRTAKACEMTKWFDTNYHYIVPELGNGDFRLSDQRMVDLYLEARELGYAAKPVLLGPVTFLLLGKKANRPPADLLAALMPVYQDLLGLLGREGAKWVQMDEPALVTDLSSENRDLYRKCYAELAKTPDRPSIIVQTYFGYLGKNWETAQSLPVEGLGLDLVRDGGKNLEAVTESPWPKDKVLGAGVVNGRNIWRTNLREALGTLDRLADHLGSVENIWVHPSCSLLHVPVTVEGESKLDEELREWLAFADEKLEELAILGRGLNQGEEVIADELAANDEVFKGRKRSPRLRHAPTRERLASLEEDMYRREQPFAQRIQTQQERLNLPLFPTTTIGSFPQTSEVRKKRRDYRSGSISSEEYAESIKEFIRDAVRKQEEIGLDVLVHGEFERNDMVEYFGEQLAGFAFTKNAWVQSYGSRYVKPPIIYGDVYRPQAMTVATSTFAAGCTQKPMKGMLTGPVTMLNWSFVREDQTREETCRQIALALRDEVVDLEAAGIKLIQVDEPALREGLPLKKEDWAEYLRWAVACFRLATSAARPKTQIHTHMCYSEFNDIIDSIGALDADVISIENSRSDRKLLEVFQTHRYQQQIGPGVYDVHSPRVPEVQEMLDNLRQTASVLAPDQLWVNPDCGLKTRGWEETVPALRNMVAAAHAMRKEFGG